ncbi:alkaline phosphatase family protein [Nakamurella endophytica]|uniref:PKD domain-containing protein n=1 Tax=Nakamurella endophytica TaxID=1748367 RepID=A0A917SRG8_9ACTN|nr:alkaline phosphatase family protein [Nakamurella endophytica]GGL93975.1 hypothetical protein GCM10011594_12280 [Nakamurella endophytica]
MSHRRLAASFAALATALAATAGPATQVAASPPRPGSAATPVTAATVATVPRLDHVVVVVMENHSASAVIGNPDAPYINHLAATGASMTQSYALTHPSQPNYIALFSGDTQGIVDDSCPHTFTAPDLGSALIAAGGTFTGYSEDLPSVGYTGCASGNYARKHSPWVNFPAVPASANQPMTAFPSDPSQLPRLAFVIPNLQNDMHDGTVAQADTWVRDKLDGYVQWAATHDSVLVLTFDEDDNKAGNRIATVLHGAGIVPGDYAERIDHYSVLRTIEDAVGVAPLGRSAATAPILDIWAPDPQAPTAAFTASCADLTCAVDGSASAAAPGATVTGYRWDWGDGTPEGQGEQPSHDYRLGDWTVTLIVTDDQGRSAATTRRVSPRPPGQASLFVSDDFSRTVSGGLGTAALGGSWATGAGSAYSVSGGTARITTAKVGQTLTAGLPAVTRTDTDLRMTLGEDRLASGGGLYLAVVGRHVATNVEYQGKLRIRADGSVVIGIQALAGTATATAVRADAVLPGITVTAGARLATRMQVVGTDPTTLRWKVWPATAAEPAAWSQTATDATPALQAAGSVGLSSYLSSSGTVAPVVTLVSAVSAQSTTAAPPPNQPPVAGFTASCTGLACAVDGSASTDPDGSVSGWSWDWGDGTAAGSGRTATHTYAAAGSYPVRLTVTDGTGATGTATRAVTVAAPDSRFVVDTFARTVSGGWGTADRGGAWTVTGGATRFSVGGGVGSMVLASPGLTVGATLAGVRSTDTDLRLALATDRLASNNGTYLTVVGRRVAGNTEYQATVRIAGSGAVVAGLALLNGSSTAVALRPGATVPGLTATAGTPLRVRLQVTGTSPTTVRLKVWSSTAAEPTAWTATATDSTAALQAPGSVALTAYLSSGSTNAPVTVRVGDLWAAPATG